MQAKNFDQLAIKLGHFLIRHPFWVIIASLLLTIMFSLGASKLSFSNSYRIFFSDENPELNAFDDFLDIYSKNDLALIVIQSPTGKALEKEYAETIEWATEEAWRTPFATRVDSIANFQYSYSEEDDLIVENLVEFAEDLSQAAAALARRASLALLRARLLMRLRGHSPNNLCRHCRPHPFGGFFAGPRTAGFF